jgi:membrane protein DedA with SNARE-associated domain
LLATIIFWSTYVVLAAYVLYDATPPLGRTLMLILGGYAAILGALTVALLRRGRPASPDGDRRA